MRYPSGLPFIIGNEAAERFSYYGMKAILVTFMTTQLINAQGHSDVMNEAEATAWFHYFGMANYFFPIIGALVADVIWGKYRTIFYLSIVYCIGHGVLACNDTRSGLFVGLLLIAIGAGGIKPCVSAHAGDQFTSENKSLLPKMFSIFYFSINVGAFSSSLLTPIFLDSYGPEIAFGIPGVCMVIATIVFWLGRHRFRAVPPVGWRAYRTIFSNPEARTALKRVSILFLHISVFWSIFDQMGSAWVIQATKMQRSFTVPAYSPILSGLTFELLPAQIQALNPILILLLIPLFSYVIYPLCSRCVPMYAIRKILLGMICTAIAFALSGLAQIRIDQGLDVSILWQCAAMLVLTIAEIMVSITALEVAYTKAPQGSKSIVMGLFYLSVSLGNFITALVNQLLDTVRDISALSGSGYYFFFSLLMIVTTCSLWLFVHRSQYWRTELYFLE